jgi:hypothetical protein
MKSSEKGDGDASNEVGNDKSARGKKSSKINSHVTVTQPLITLKNPQR